MLQIGYFAHVKKPPVNSKSPSRGILNISVAGYWRKTAPDVLSPPPLWRAASLSHSDSPNAVPPPWGWYLWPSPLPLRSPSVSTVGPDTCPPLQLIQTDSHSTALHHVDKVIKEQINWTHAVQRAHTLNEEFGPTSCETSEVTFSRVPGWSISDLGDLHIHPIWAEN